MRMRSRRATIAKWLWLLLAAGFVVGLLVFVCGLYLVDQDRVVMVQREERARLARAAAQRAAAEAALAAARLVEGQKRRNTIQYVDSWQSPAHGAGDQTDAQRKASWDVVFSGQWVRWRGEVVEVCGRGATCSVSLRVAPTTYSSDTSFDLPRAVAVQLAKDRWVTVEGRLADHSMFGYRLYDVRVVGW